MNIDKYNLEDLTQYGLEEMQQLIETILSATSPEDTMSDIWSVLDQHIHALHRDIEMTDWWIGLGTLDWQACLYVAAGMAWSLDPAEFDYNKQAIVLRLQHTLSSYMPTPSRFEMSGKYTPVV